MSLTKILAFVALACALVSLLGIPATVYILPIGLACIAAAVLMAPSPL